VRALVTEGFTVSVDSGDPAELARGAAAGAAFLLSLTEHTLKLAFDTEAVPVLIPAEPGDMPSLYRACERLDRAGRPYLADPILDPINVGFVESLARYRELRRQLPETPMLMGVGNLTELTDADTPGVTTLLMATCVELGIDNVLVVQVSPHCRRAVREADRSWRMLAVAARDRSLPQGYDESLLCLRDRRPFPNSPTEIAESARQVSDPNFRIEVAEDGIHVYNRAGHHVAKDPFDLFPELGVEHEGGHAFYLGVELARAQIALQLGKRYAQDAQLRWGCAVDPPPEESTHLKAVGTTLVDRREGKGRAGRS
jgi:dihydropteroate synthase-like protein